MEISVRLFAGLRGLAGSDRLTIEVPDGASAGDARAAIEAVVGRVPFVLAVDREYARDEQQLEPGSELAAVPPVSGGAIVEGPLSLDAVLERVRDPRAGAIVTFSGVTRDVPHLDYEAYEEMAGPLLDRIVEEAIGRHGLCAAAADHRHGRVALGEASVVVAASARHREQAFAGAREIIDRLKDLLPVWKLEQGEWVPGSLPDAEKPAVSGGKSE